MTHTIRCLSATATILGDEVAVIVQRDVTESRSGTIRIGGCSAPQSHLHTDDKIWIIDIGAEQLPVLSPDEPLTEIAAATHR